jgi:DNA mismatch repair ATPase MutS
MPAVSTVRELPAEPGLVRALGPVATKSERAQLRTSLRKRAELKRLIDQAKQDRDELDHDVAWLAEHFDQPAPPDMETAELSAFAVQARAKKREAEKHMKPAAQALSDLMADADSDLDEEVRQLLRDGLYVLEGYLRHFNKLHEMLERQLAERLASSEKMRRAKPAKGEVDHEALTREFMARFPKLRAALAK